MDEPQYQNLAQFEKGGKPAFEDESETKEEDQYENLQFLLANSTEPAFASKSTALPDSPKEAPKKATDDGPEKSPKKKNGKAPRKSPKKRRDSKDGGGVDPTKKKRLTKCGYWFLTISMIVLGLAIVGAIVSAYFFL